MTEKSSRREFLSSVSATVAGAGLSSVVPGKWILDPRKPFAPQGSQALKDHAAAKGMLFGAAGRQDLLSRKADLAQLFAQQCNILVPEGELKWGQLRPTPDTFNFAPAEWLLNFCQQNNMKFRGHTLVWYQGIPKWFNSYVNASNAKPLLLNHINTVVGHFAGKMESWDVINEVMNPKDGRPDGLRNSPWLQFLGPDYLELAFRTAYAADPKALMIWNENWLEEETPEGESKRRAMIKILKDMQSRNVPIHGIGIQSHLVGDHASNIAGEGFQRFLHEVSDMNLKIIISELDVTDQNLPADSAARDQAVANLYYSYLSTVLKHKSVIAVLTWGLTDNYSWLGGFKARPDKLPVRPLPFDGNMSPKPVWNAVARAFDEAPAR
jgi:endo-1,4-beta-xylanase